MFVCVFVEALCASVKWYEILSLYGNMCAECLDTIPCGFMSFHMQIYTLDIEISSASMTFMD